MRVSGKPKRYTQEEILNAIKDTGAIISTIAEKLDCSWDTAQKYCNKYASTRQAIKNEKETINDLAESTLIKSIKNGDTTSAKWYLSKKAKDRGYGEEVANTTQTDYDPQITFVFDSDDTEPAQGGDL